MYSTIIYITSWVDQIGPHLPKLLSNIKWLTFLEHGEYLRLELISVHFFSCFIWKEEQIDHNVDSSLNCEMQIAN